MEYRLNKIDTDIRRKINEKTSGGKIHKNTEVKVQPDVKRKREREDKKPTLPVDEKRFVTIDGYKYGEEIKVEANLETEEKEIASRGIFIDTRK